MKRKGFTLIELMVVIAIIIILAAVAIPNYLSMTERAKKSRVASDFSAVATALETFRTDWGKYPPITAAEKFGATVTTTPGSFFNELSGTGTCSVNTGLTAAGDQAPIHYMTSNILKSMINPYSNAAAAEYTYLGDNNGKHWLLVAPTDAAATTTTVLSRTDETTALNGPSTALPIPTD